MTKVIVVGAGRWAHQGWAPLLRELAGRLDVVAVVDPNQESARSLAVTLGVDPAVTYETVDQALDRHPAAQAGLVLSAPAQHAPAVAQLAAAGLHVLTEKPLATNPEDLDLVVRTVRQAGIKGAVMQNYRSQARVQLARRLIAGNELGRLRYLVVRFAADYREPGAWHGDRSNSLVDTAIHHLDVLRYLTGAEITHVTAVTSNPEPASFDGDCLGGLLVQFDDGTFALYEVSLLAAGSENRWRDVSYRAECSDGAVVCDGPEVHIQRGHDVETIAAPDIDQLDGHRQQLRAFVDWLDGGPAVATTVEDNSRSITATFAALASSRERQTVAVPVAPLEHPPA
jgi:predicted dehydrogenase